MSLEIAWYLVNVAVLAFPLAIFEIWLERGKNGLGGEFYSPFWGKKIRWRWLLKVMEKDYITPYHLMMFAVVLPAIYTTEYFLLRHWFDRHGWVLALGGLRLVPALFLPALWLGVATLEDYLWFVLNWYYPDALQKLYRGEFTWHTRYVHVTRSVVLPRFYLTVPIWVTSLLVAQHWIVS